MEPCSEQKLRCAGISRSFKGNWTPYLVIKAIARFIYIFLNNLYGIPTYLLWVFLLRPLVWHERTRSLYWFLEGYLFKWLLIQVGSWLWTADYKVCEVGEDITPVLRERCLMLCNHQSTGDVPLLMHTMYPHHRLPNSVMWIMDIMFKYSNFGFVSQVHGDFFIQQGKATRHLQLLNLEQHLRTVYREHEMSWLVVFPEGGFLRKRRETSNQFAQKNGIAPLEHVTLPRVGAMKVCLDTLASQQNGFHTNHKANGQVEHKSSVGLQWVVDITIGYPQGQPLDMFAITFGHRPPCTTQVLYRLYPVHELPRGEEELLQWMYQRYREKEHLLDEFYATGEFPALDAVSCRGKGKLIEEGKRYIKPSVAAMVFANLFGLGTMYYAFRVLACVMAFFSWFV